MPTAKQIAQMRVNGEIPPNPFSEFLRNHNKYRPPINDSMLEAEKYVIQNSWSQILERVTPLEFYDIAGMLENQPGLLIKFYTIILIYDCIILFIYCNFENHNRSFLVNILLLLTYGYYSIHKKLHCNI